MRICFSWPPHSIVVILIAIHQPNLYVPYLQTNETEHVYKNVFVHSMINSGMLIQNPDLSGYMSPLALYWSKILLDKCNTLCCINVYSVIPPVVDIC